MPFIPRTLTEYGTAWHPAGPHNSRTLQPLVSNCMPFFFGGGWRMRPVENHMGIFGGNLYLSPCFSENPEESYPDRGRKTRGGAQAQGPIRWCHGSMVRKISWQMAMIASGFHLHTWGLTVCIDVLGVSGCEQGLSSHCPRRVAHKHHASVYMEDDCWWLPLWNRCHIQAVELPKQPTLQRLCVLWHGMTRDPCFCVLHSFPPWFLLGELPNFERQTFVTATWGPGVPKPSPVSELRRKRREIKTATGGSYGPMIPSAPRYLGGKGRENVWRFFIFFWMFGIWNWQFWFDIFFSSRKLGIIFFKWVGSTTNYSSSYFLFWHFWKKSFSS